MKRILKKLISYFLSLEPEHESDFGQTAENYATSHLRSSGFEIIQQNVKAKFGEIDIIAYEKETLVFIEVKALRSLKYGEPWEKVDYEKQRRLSRLAAWYIKKHPHPGLIRFDVVSIFWPEDLDSPKELKHFRNAFESTL